MLGHPVISVDPEAVNLAYLYRSLGRFRNQNACTFLLYQERENLVKFTIFCQNKRREKDELSLKPFRHPKVTALRRISLL